MYKKYGIRRDQLDKLHNDMLRKASSLGTMNPAHIHAIPRVPSSCYTCFSPCSYELRELTYDWVDGVPDTLFDGAKLSFVSLPQGKKHPDTNEKLVLRPFSIAAGSVRLSAPDNRCLHFISLVRLFPWSDPAKDT
ncbi:unnamed protein product [Vitrella brassicaformis CCMP3155]|uniref:Uncharacterized protein n=1 Tax=Vitrella brassicaformis (strain CCMP3155) TaxID=1169540 RepID=A0A0G4GIH9_VITBC|nr:unnamed protein product [Vitrella brassicaformis CCMP3155]|eukprot:CEM29641.1 unnamed protein product [Vitrella brassicaformis CCMP3155]